MRLLTVLCAGLVMLSAAGTANAAPFAAAPAATAGAAMPVEKTHGVRFRFGYGYPGYYWGGPSYYYPRYYARPSIFYYPRYYRHRRLVRYPHFYYRPWWGYRHWYRW